MVTDPKTAVKAGIRRFATLQRDRADPGKDSHSARRMDLITAASADPLATEGAPDARRMDLIAATATGPRYGRSTPMRAEWT